MANMKFGIKYTEAEQEIKKIEKAIEDLYINVELIDRNTNGITKDTWVGKDADAYQTKILGYSEKLKSQTEYFSDLIKNLKTMIEEIKEQEEIMSSDIASQNNYNFNS